MGVQQDTAHSWPTQATRDWFAKCCHDRVSLRKGLPSPLTELRHKSWTRGKKQSSKAVMPTSKTPSRGSPHEGGTGTGKPCCQRRWLRCMCVAVIMLGTVTCMHSKCPCLQQKGAKFDHTHTHREK